MCLSCASLFAGGQKIEKERRKQAEMEAAWQGRKGGMDIGGGTVKPQSAGAVGLAEGDSLPPLSKGGSMRASASATAVVAGSTKKR